MYKNCTMTIATTTSQSCQQLHHSNTPNTLQPHLLLQPAMRHVVYMKWPSARLRPLNSPTRHQTFHCAHSRPALLRFVSCLFHVLGFGPRFSRFLIVRLAPFEHLENPCANHSQGLLCTCSLGPSTLFLIAGCKCKMTVGELSLERWP